MGDGPRIRQDMTPVVKLEIEVNRQGVTQVSGPLANKGLCYEMLVEAFIMVRNFKGQPVPEPKIIPAHQVPDLKMEPGV